MSELQVRLPVVIDFAVNTYVEVEVTKGSTKGYIAEVQIWLNETFNAGLVVDNCYGPKTKAL